MRKFLIFSIFFVVFFGVTFNYAQAEVKDFYIPVAQGEANKNLVEIITSAISDNLFKKALAAWGYFGDWGYGEFVDYICCGGASDWHFGELLKPEIYCNFSPYEKPKFKRNNCPAPLAEKEGKSFWSFLPKFLVEKAEAIGICWEPICAETRLYPWQVIEATLTTYKLDIKNYNYNKDKDKCKMDVHIVDENSICNTSGQTRFASAENFCRQSNGEQSITAKLDLNSSQSAAGFCGHVRADAESGPNANVHWTGSVRVKARRTSLDSFSVTGKDAITKVNKTVVGNQALKICQGDSVIVNWKTSDSGGNQLYTGEVNEPSVIANGLDEVQNSKNYTPGQTVTFFVNAYGVSGSGPRNIFSDPINVIPVPCGECDPSLSNPNVACIAKYGYGTACCRDDNRSCDVCGGGPTPSVTPTPSSTPIPAGNLDVKIRLNEVEVTTPTNVIYDIMGPQTINATEGPKTFSSIAIGTYIITYKSGGPMMMMSKGNLFNKAQAQSQSSFMGYSPGQSMLVSANQTATVYLDFSDGAGRCNITVQALKSNCDGSDPVQWTGALSYGLLGPIILNGTAVNQTFENIPVGRYYLTSLVGGPGTYNGVEPGNPVACPSGGNVTLTMKFKDCDDHYKCNYSTGRCELCGAYSEECKYSNLPACNMRCDGCATSHDPKANIFCWANFDSDNCVGVNDNNANTPSVILYDKSTDSCGDIKNCTWEIKSIQGGIQNIPNVNTCAPYPWYDETPGKYTAKLTVTDSLGKSSSDTQQFTIKNIDALTCNFAWDPNAPTVGGATSFFDQSLTPNGTTLKSWSWIFQDASPASSTAQTVQNVVFNSAGAKNVTLTVKNSANATCTLTKQIKVKTINPYWKEVIPF